MSMIIILNHQRLQLVVLKTHHYENYQRESVLDRHRKVKIPQKIIQSASHKVFKKMTETRPEKVRTEDDHFFDMLAKKLRTWLRDHRKNILTGNSPTYC